MTLGEVSCLCGISWSAPRRRRGARSLEWGPPDLSARLSGEPTFFEISADDAEQMLVDLIVDVRSERNEKPYSRWTTYVWFERRSDVFDLDKASVLYRTNQDVKEVFIHDRTWAPTRAGSPGRRAGSSCRPTT
ncbi:hypothetical protein ACFWNN_23140 [Lentzea sp. NPDC058450]|uniref:hypothetical protein n=1 Tax=Lentzea sp. NPDC058450 TaxID=3346505 RepID=UPI00364A280D